MSMRSIVAAVQLTVILIAYGLPAYASCNDKDNSAEAQNLSSLWNNQDFGLKQKWTNNGFSKEQALEWTKCGFDSDNLGMGDGADAIPWRNKKFSPEEADKWSRVLDAEEASEWRHAGFSPKEAKSWTEVGFSRFSPRHAVAWRHARIPPEESYVLMQSGIAIKDAKVTLSEISQICPSGMSLSNSGSKFDPSARSALFLMGPYSNSGYCFYVTGVVMQDIDRNHALVSDEAGDITYVDFGQNDVPPERNNIRGLFSGEGAVTYTGADNARHVTPSVKALSYVY